MSKRHKKQTQNRFPWSIILAGAALLFMAVYLIAIQKETGSGTPSISVDQQIIDYGDVTFNTEKTFSIKVTNTGNGVLRFAKQPYIQVMEGCWPPQLTIGSMVLDPGESTMVESSVFMMHEGMDGPHDFAVHLMTNDPNNPDFVVHILSNWIP